METNDKRPISTLVIILILFLNPFTINAQKARTYKVSVKLVNKTEVKGIVYSVNKQAFVVRTKDSNVVKLTPDIIKSIKLKQKGRVGRSALMGAAGGALIGAAIGFIAGDDYAAGSGLFSFYAEEKAAIGAIGLGSIGALIGLRVGSAKKEFIINGDIDAYLSVLPEIWDFIHFQGVSQKEVQLNKHNATIRARVSN